MSAAATAATATTEVLGVPTLPIDRLASLVKDVCNGTGTIKQITVLLDEFHDVLNPIFRHIDGDIHRYLSSKKPFGPNPDFPLKNVVAGLNELLIKIRKALRIQDYAVFSRCHKCVLEGVGCGHAAANHDSNEIAQADHIRVRFGLLDDLGTPVSRVGDTLVPEVRNDIMRGGIQVCKDKVDVAGDLVKVFAELFGDTYNLCTLCCSELYYSNGPVVVGYFPALNMPEILVKRSPDANGHRRVEKGWKINPELQDRFYVGTEAFFYLNATSQIRVTKMIGGYEYVEKVIFGDGLQVLNQQ